MDALIGTTVAHYRVDEVLGSGGMGVVYGAHDTKLDRAVALKVLPDEIARDAAALQRLRREAQALAAVQHPNIASIYGFEDQAALPFLVLERVHGETLASRLQRGPLALEEALRIGHTIASALHVAHERDVVHRDLKPGNVMIATSGVIKVLDFGIAQRETGSSPDQTRTRLTQTGAAIGTPGYMSPEQILASDLDHRTDIFSLGCLLYECLAGTPPFQGVTAAEVMASTIHRDPSWRLLPGPTPSRIRALLERCLDKEPDRRPLRMSQVRDEIDACLQGRETDTVVLPPEAPEKRHNLPHQLTSFIGRKREVGEVHALLRETRLLTLTGVGGSGKSRLMLRAADGLVDSYPEGVWFVDLSGTADPARVPAVLAAAVGVREEPGRPLIETLSAHLRDRKALLLLDNCEHLLLVVAEQVHALLRSCPLIRFLATSREAMNTEGERTYPVPPLALPDVRSGDVASSSEAVRLFVDRARLVRPEFSLDEHTTPIVVEICVRLDGIPLALELAAARTKILAVAQISARLDDRFRLLTGGSRTALSRHQTLRATIQWSYDQLAEDEQQLLRGLSVFAGGWTLDAATAVSGGTDDLVVLDRLTALMERSLIQVDRAPSASTRFRFLETLRQYATEVLRDKGEDAVWRDRHLDYIVRFVERAEPQLIGPDQDEWFERLEAEHENILAALAWCAESQGAGTKALRIGGSLWRFWWYGAHFSLGLTALQTALENDRGAVPTAERAQALYAAAQMARELGRLDLARDLFQQSLEVAIALDDPARIARAYNGLGNTAEYAGDYAAARDYHEKSLYLSRKLGNTRAIAIDLHNLAIVLMYQRELARSATLFEEALGIFREIGDVNSTQATVTNLASVATQRGEYPAARVYFAESFRLAEELPSQTLTADSLESLAVLAVEVGALELAARVLGTAVAVRERTGYTESVENRSIMESTVTRIRMELGEDRHAALEAEGRATTFEDAVHSVRAWLSGGRTPAADSLDA